jgi:hypothetical protein
MSKVWIDKMNHLLIDYNVCADKLLKGLMKSNQDDISFHSTEIKHIVSERNLTVMGGRNRQNGAESVSYMVWKQDSKQKGK